MTFSSIHLTWPSTMDVIPPFALLLAGCEKGEKRKRVLELSLAPADVHVHTAARTYVHVVRVPMAHLGTTHTNPERDDKKARLFLFARFLIEKCLLLAALDPPLVGSSL